MVAWVTIPDSDINSDSPGTIDLFADLRNNLNYLKANLATAGPVLIEEIIASDDATVEFITGIDSTYDEYEIHIIGLRPANDAEDLNLLVSEDTGSTWKSGASDYAWAIDGNRSAGSAPPVVNNNATVIQLTGANAKLGNVSSESYSGVIKIFNPASAAHKKLFSWTAVYADSDNNFATITGVGGYKGTVNAIDGLQFAIGSGNITEGIFRLVGIRKAEVT